MKEIKTICKRLDNSQEFDDEVNQALREGWRLTKREVLQPPAQPNNGSTYFYSMLYAELERYDAPEEVRACYCKSCKYKEFPDTYEPCVACNGRDYWEPRDDE